MSDRAVTAMQGAGSQKTERDDGAAGAEVRAEGSVDAGDSSSRPLFRDALCAVDGTRASLAAVAQAASLVGPHGKLTLLAVTSAGSGAPQFRSAAISSLRVRRVLDRSARVAEEAGVAHEQIVDPGGPPSAVIVERGAGYDLLALGAPARSPLGAFGGGVASATLRSFTTPLLLARPVPVGGRLLDAVVVASDASESSERIVDLAARLLEGRDASAVLVHALGSESHSQPHRMAAESETLGQACGGRVSVVTEPRDACATIVDAARREGATLAVIGSRRRAGIGSTLGSVSRRAVHALPCSVLVIPPEAISG